MAFGGFNQGNPAAQTKAEINMIPLIDVMLVLLVIFMLTAPLMTHAVKLELPKASSQALLAPKQAVTLSIDSQGSLFWDKEKLERTTLNERMQALGKQEEPPEIHIYADQSTPYHFIAETLADAAQANLSKIGFVSEPLANAP